ncbi:MAG: amidohydrolase family protein, partial [Longimicrobiales bacterium]
MRTLVPDLLYRHGEFHPGLALEYDDRTGRITRILPQAQITGDRVALPGRALLPGFVNAHSHAFQRLIRGRTQWRPTAGADSDFWTWRQAMYAAALALSPDDVYDVSRFCFIEMLRAGFTAVGEFHYLHRDAAGRAYADPLELARRVIAAAEDAGIRICLLHVAYATGGIGEPLRPEQRRFATPDLDGYLAMVAELARGNVARPLVTTGAAPHSVRAVPRDWIAPIHELAFGYGLPFHMHVSEQLLEVSACLDAYGVRPVELLADEGVADDHLTA